MGAKVVSLKSTLSMIWVVLVVLGGFDDLGLSPSLGLSRPCLIYAAAFGLACWTIYGGRRSP